MKSKQAVLVVVVVLLLGLVASVVLVQKRTQDKSSAAGSGKVYLSLKVLEDNGLEKKIGVYVNKVEGLANVSYLTAHIKFDPEQVDTSQAGKDNFLLNSRVFIGDSASSPSPLSSWKSTAFSLEPSLIKLQILTGSENDNLAPNNSTDLLVASLALKFKTLEQGVEMDFDSTATTAQGSGGISYDVQLESLKLDPENVVKLYFGQQDPVLSITNQKFTVPLMLNVVDKRIAGVHIEIMLQTDLQIPYKLGVATLQENSSFDKVYSRVYETDKKIVIDALFNPKKGSTPSYTGTLRVVDISIIGREVGSLTLQPECQKEGDTANCAATASTGSIITEVGGNGENILKFVRGVSFDIVAPEQPTNTPTQTHPPVPPTATPTPINVGKPLPMQPGRVSIGGINLSACSSNNGEGREVVVVFNDRGVGQVGTLGNNKMIIGTFAAPGMINSITVFPIGYLPVRVSGQGIKYRDVIDLTSIRFTPGNSSGDEANVQPDEIINSLDFAQFITDFEDVILNNKPAMQRSDFDCNNKVEVRDYTHLISNWGKKNSGAELGDDL